MADRTQQQPMLLQPQGQRHAIDVMQSGLQMQRDQLTNSEREDNVDERPVRYQAISIQAPKRQGGETVRTSGQPDHRQAELETSNPREVAGACVGVFKHKPLRSPQTQIRLLRLQSGRRDDDIVCTLEVYELDEAPPFQAISYTWGSSEQQRAIIVNDESLAVFENCHYALWQLRIHQDPNALVWLDSICIDQDDLFEKCHQVRRISTIFARAVMTFTCVGPHEDDSEFLFQRIQSLRLTVDLIGHGAVNGCDFCDSLLSDTPDVRLTDKDSVHGMHTWLIQQPASLFKRQHDALFAFDQRSYWVRAWIVPEIAASRTVHVLCGPHCCALPEVTRLTNLHLWTAQEFDRDAKEEAIQSHVRRLLAGFDPEIIECWYLFPGLSKPFTNLARLPMISKSELSVMTYMENYECSDPRDKIFATMDLINWDPHFPLPTIDYQMSAFDLATQVIPHLRNRPELPAKLLFRLGYEREAGLLPSLACESGKKRFAFPTRQEAAQGAAVSSKSLCLCASDISYVQSRTTLWFCQRYSTRIFVLFDRNGALAITSSWAADTSSTTSFSLDGACQQQLRAGSALTGVREDGTTKVIGRITDQARQGDLLIRWEMDCFVLRQRSQGTYEIVGAALLFLVHESLHEGTRLHLHFDPKDYIARTVIARKLNQDRFLESDPCRQLEADIGTWLGTKWMMHRFSSFATLCPGHREVDYTNEKFPCCIQCCLGDNQRVCVCVHCGRRLMNQEAESQPS